MTEPRLITPTDLAGALPEPVEAVGALRAKRASPLCLSGAERSLLVSLVIIALWGAVFWAQH
jgi:hypothetical protein